MTNLKNQIFTIQQEVDKIVNKINDTGRALSPPKAFLKKQSNKFSREFQKRRGLDFEMYNWRDKQSTEEFSENNSKSSFGQYRYAHNRKNKKIYKSTSQLLRDARSESAENRQS